MFLFFGVVIVLVAISAPIIYFSTHREKRPDTPSTLKHVPIPVPDTLSKRIDCIPEAQGSVIKATKELCRRRGCIYKPSKGNAPKCFFPIHEEHGFAVLGSDIQTGRGFRVNLKRKGKSPFGDESVDFSAPVFEMERRGENVLRFKVRT